jgi:hypothetical protein
MKAIMMMQQRSKAEQRDKVHQLHYEEMAIQGEDSHTQ